METAAIAQHDVLRQPRRNPVDAGHHRLHDLDAAQMPKGLSCTPPCKDEDPEVDVDGPEGLRGTRTISTSLRKIDQELLSEILIDADTHHLLSVPD